MTLESVTLPPAVASVEQSFTTITLIFCRRGDSFNTDNPLRLASIRYCSLYAGTMTDKVVLVRFSPLIA